MKRNHLILLTSLLLASAAGFSALGQGRRAANQPLSEAAKTALIEALTSESGEYAARALYNAVLENFSGDPLPYARIVLAEENHVAALVQQFQRFGLEVPADNVLVNVPKSLAAAAAAGVAAEVANIKMYDELLPVVVDYPSIVQVFTNLRAASQNHQGAFERAVASGGATTQGNCLQTDCPRLQQGAGCPMNGMGRMGGRGGMGGCRQNGAGCPNAGAGCLRQ